MSVSGGKTENGSVMTVSETEGALPTVGHFWNGAIPASAEVI